MASQPSAPASERAAARAARIAIDRGDYTAALALIDDTLKRFGSRPSEDVWALRVMRGEAYEGLGDWKTAAQVLAFEMPPSLRTSETAFQHAVMRAFALNRTDKVAEARELLETARALAAARRPAALADIYFALTRIAPQDRQQQAREAIRLARQHRRKTVEAKAMAALAFELAAAGRFAESVEWGEQALTLARAVGIAKTIEQIEGNLGWAYRELGDYETALQLFTSAEAAARRLGSKRTRVSWLIQLGNIREERRDWAGAKAFNEEAVTLARETGHTQLGFALANLARIAIATGRFDDARRLNREALQHKRNDREAELRSYILDAHILVVEERKYDDAAKLLAEVLRDTKRALTRTEALGELAQLYVRTNRPDLAEAQFRRAIAAAAEAGAEVTNADLRFSLANTSAEIFGQYVDFLVRANRVEDALAVTETSRAQLLEEGLGVRAELDARAIARQNDATILCYWLGRDRSYLWVVTRNGVRLETLPPDTTIEKAAEAYARDLVGPRGSMQMSGARGQALFEMLVRPALPSIPNGSRVIVVADGRLHALNFETLVAPSPQRYWIEDVVLMNAGSLQLLARAARKPAPAPQLLLVGNAPSPAPYLPLPFAAEEMRAIAKRFARRKVLEGASATPAAYRSAAPEKFDYLHFVAHGEATRKRPLDSAVILARDPSAQYKLLARDVAGHPLTARLVTISSCHGAGTRTYEGEGVVGLAWAFLKAGADQVIAALWEVNDAETPRLMDRMYAGIGAGKDPAVALREAKLQFVRGTGRGRRPQFWAPFVLYAGT
ncbi:MAG TPA: CHAT domain-containing protein [Thermoanaerobaculia bacterium]